MTKFSDLIGPHGATIEWKGKRMQTTDVPYVMQVGEELYAHEMYNAPALDEDGNEYVIYWEITDAETTDESEACDWANPTSVIPMSEVSQ